MRFRGIVAGVIWLATCATASASDGWQVAAAAGGDLRFAPSAIGYGFALVDATRPVTSSGKLRLLYNTDTLQASLESVSLAPRLELSVAARGEALYAGILPQYIAQGESFPERGFWASYVQGWASLKWHPKPGHSLELQLAARKWFFHQSPRTASDFLLPPSTFVFEPRLYYTFWRLHGKSREWMAHTLFPRIEGVAFKIQAGLDVRANARAWGARIDGALSARNHPGRAIFRLRQQMLAGKGLGTWGRLQLEQYGSWGQGEDDLTRNRVGGMNPYVVPVHGLPWAALLSERLLSAQLSLHVGVGHGDAHELGVAVSGGTFNDVRRQGALMHFGGAAGAGAFADLRFGTLQAHVRLGYAFPVAWLLATPSISGLVAIGAPLK